MGMIDARALSGRVIIPDWTRSRSIGYVADARLENTSPSADIPRRSCQERLPTRSCLAASRSVPVLLVTIGGRIIEKCR